ncbi:hypothetical protein AVEN_100547-1 [Araneus ventricosus]|uniref:Tc1-like transposase DDE domain-containing protein n=1 Tax=Araneus ventricosus TaxID=182803 RepID=A0A4Y2I824_ARAVE|nr:hypothetical protein AVEN_100547-1 [Araneus ventricosus]
MLDGRTPLHVFERGTVTGVRYRDEILEPCVRLFRGAVGPEFILMDDNEKPHRALLVDEFLESEDIRRMDWPARSPDLNPIEHVWDALGRAFATRNPLPRTIQEMKTALLNERDQLPQEMINCLISIPHKNYFHDQNDGRDGPVVRSQLQDRIIPCSQPDSTEGPLYMSTCFILNHAQCLKLLFAGVVRKFGERVQIRWRPRHPIAVQDYEVTPKIPLLLLQNGSLK